MKKGILISIEGIDGCGKTLLIQNLKEKFDAVFTFEPGRTNLGSKLRHILHEEKETTCDISEYLLFAANRAQHFHEIVIPALLSGKIVISDRMADSSVAYQGYGRELDIKMIEQINRWAMQNIVPDWTVYIKIDVQKAFERIAKRNEKLTSFEKEKKQFWTKVINGYETIFKNRNNLIVVDGTLSPDEVASQTFNKLLEVLK